MAGPYYVDTAGSNTSPYDTWAKAATNLQTVVDAMGSGETVYCRGTQTLTAQIDMDGASGTAAATNRFIGCDASGDVVGGTERFILDADSTAVRCLYFNDMDYCEFINFDLRNATGDGVNAQAAITRPTIFVNCRFADNADNGVESSNDLMRGFLFSQCVFDANSSGTVSVPGTFIACSFLDNTEWGIELSESGLVCYGCIFSGNTTGGVQDLSDGNRFFHCIFDGHGGAGDEGYNGYFSTEAVLVGCRFTNNTTGVSLDASTNAFIAYCYLDDTVGGSGDAINIVDSTDTSINTFSGSDSNDGYETGEFNLASGATGRSIAVEVPAS